MIYQPLSCLHRMFLNKPTQSMRRADCSLVAPSISSGVLSTYAKHVQLSEQPRGQASLSRIQSRGRGFRKCPVFLQAGIAAYRKALYRWNSRYVYGAFGHTNLTKTYSKFPYRLIAFHITLTRGLGKLPSIQCKTHIAVKG